jgi:hypothetical protein
MLAWVVAAVVLVPGPAGAERRPACGEIQAGAMRLNFSNCTQQFKLEYNSQVRRNSVSTLWHYTFLKALRSDVVSCRLEGLINSDKN